MLAVLVPVKCDMARIARDERRSLETHLHHDRAAAIAGVRPLIRSLGACQRGCAAAAAIPVTAAGRCAVAI